MDLEVLHKKSLHNKAELQNTNRCGCYYCLNIYETSEIKEWIDKGDTAICPHCGIDSVVPDTSSTLTKEILTELRKLYF